MPVIKLKSVVLPAPFGPMMALRSPGMMRNVTSRVACKPPKLLHRPLSSRTGMSAAVLTHLSSVKVPGLNDLGPGALALFAELAGRIVAVIDRMSEELFL